MQRALRDYVIDDFCAQYLSGRTPNPCVRCNQYLKFNILLKKAVALGASHLATGHYARVQKVGLRYRLAKARDTHKDQSYFLYRLSQTQLRHVLFPLGDYTKQEVRAFAREWALPVCDKPESQEICFVTHADYRTFLQEYAASAGFDISRRIKPGVIVDRSHTVLGSHRGLAFYTIGQRQGLGVAGKHPLYVLEMDYRHNTITVGTKAQAHSRQFMVKKPSYTAGALKKKVALRVRIRYNHTEAPAQVFCLGSKLKITFDDPQFAVTPGQSAVLYDNDVVVGGGIIEKITHDQTIC
jgi:tRNA-specific 2-thiouridylase